MAEPDQPEPRLPRWWYAFRRVVIFGLGVWIIVDALVEQSAANSSTVKLIVGLIMVGVLPVEDLFDRVHRHDRSTPGDGGR